MSCTCCPVPLVLLNSSAAFRMVILAPIAPPIPPPKREHATSVTVTLSDGAEYDARIVGADSSSDLAVLKVEAQNLPAATLGDSDELQIGELVVAIGNPLGYENTVTDGIVSGLNRQLTNYTDAMTLIQTNAAINSGNSGGALVNSKGEVIGINSAKLVASNAEGMGFALSINEVKPIQCASWRGVRCSYGIILTLYGHPCFCKLFHVRHLQIFSCCPQPTLHWQ